MQNVTEIQLGNIWVKTFGNPQICKSILVYFHGYPGPHIKNPNKPLAEDLFEVLNEKGFALISPHYQGLGNSIGKFGFAQTFEDAKIVLEYSSRFNLPTSILGYSWGGLVASSIFNEIPASIRHKLLLMAPVSNTFPATVLKNVVKSWRFEYEDTLQNYDSDEAAIEELLQSFAENSPQIKLQKINKNRIEIFHGKLDEVVPFKWSEDLCKTLDISSSQFHCFNNQGHDFIDRPMLLRAISDAL
jgi:alpha/beta superfamily hydrolase